MTKVFWKMLLAVPVAVGAAFVSDNAVAAEAVAVETEAVADVVVAEPID